MFNSVKINQYAKLVGLEIEEAELAIKNQAKYLKVNPTHLLKSYVVVHESRKRSYAQKAQNLKYETKNLLILKYREEIVNLYTKERFGYLKISKAMKINHNAKISKSAIENFIKQNNIVRD